MASVTGVCATHGAFSSELTTVRNRAGDKLTTAGSCPTCGRRAAAMKPGYDFTNFAVAKALASPSSAEALHVIHHHLRAIMGPVREGEDGLPFEDEFNRLNRDDPTLAAALRTRVAGRSRAEVLELLEALLEIVSVLTRAAANNRLTSQLRNTLVHTNLP
jgi:hypothetical protein